MIRRGLALLVTIATLAAPAAAEAGTDPYIVVLDQSVQHPAAAADAQERRYETSERTHVFDAALTATRPTCPWTKSKPSAATTASPTSSATAR